MKKYLLAIAAAAVVTTPAFADYYIVRGPDKKCEVVEIVPENTVQLGPLSFTTRNEAERQTEVVCDRYDDGDDDGDAQVIIKQE